MASSPATIGGRSSSFTGGKFSLSVRDQTALNAWRMQDTSAERIYQRACNQAHSAGELFKLIQYQRASEEGYVSDKDLKILKSGNAADRERVMDNIWHAHFGLPRVQQEIQDLPVEQELAHLRPAKFGADVMHPDDVKNYFVEATRNYSHPSHEREEKDDLHYVYLVASAGMSVAVPVPPPMQADTSRETGAGTSGAGNAPGAWRSDEGEPREEETSNYDDEEEGEGASLSRQPARRAGASGRALPPISSKARSPPAPKARQKARPAAADGMKYCTACDYEIASDFLVCPFCGAAQEMRAQPVPQSPPKAKPSQRNIDVQEVEGARQNVNDWINRLNDVERAGKQHLKTLENSLQGESAIDAPAKLDAVAEGYGMIKTDVTVQLGDPKLLSIKKAAGRLLPQNGAQLTKEEQALSDALDTLNRTTHSIEKFAGALDEMALQMRSASGVLSMGIGLKGIMDNANDVLQKVREDVNDVSSPHNYASAADRETALGAEVLSVDSFINDPNVSDGRAQAEGRRGRFTEAPGNSEWVLSKTLERFSGQVASAEKLTGVLDTTGNSIQLKSRLAAHNKALQAALDEENKKVEEEVKAKLAVANPKIAGLAVILDGAVSRLDAAMVADNIVSLRAEIRNVAEKEGAREVGLLIEVGLLGGLEASVLMVTRSEISKGAQEGEWIRWSKQLRTSEKLQELTGELRELAGKGKAVSESVKEERKLAKEVDGPSYEQFVTWSQVVGDHAKRIKSAMARNADSEIEGAAEALLPDKQAIKKKTTEWVLSTALEDFLAGTKDATQLVHTLETESANYENLGRLAPMKLAFEWAGIADAENGMFEKGGIFTQEMTERLVQAADVIGIAMNSGEKARLEGTLNGDVAVSEEAWDNVSDETWGLLKIVHKDLGDDHRNWAVAAGVGLRANSSEMIFAGILEGYSEAINEKGVAPLTALMSGLAGWSAKQMLDGTRAIDPQEKVALAAKADAEADARKAELDKIKKDVEVPMAQASTLLPRYESAMEKGAFSSMSLTVAIRALRLNYDSCGSMLERADREIQAIKNNANVLRTAISVDNYKLLVELQRNVRRGLEQAQDEKNKKDKADQKKIGELQEQVRLMELQLNRLRGRLGEKEAVILELQKQIADLRQQLAMPPREQEQEQKAREMLAQLQQLDMDAKALRAKPDELQKQLDTEARSIETRLSDPKGLTQEILYLMGQTLEGRFGPQISDYRQSADNIEGKLGALKIEADLSAITLTELPQLDKSVTDTLTGTRAKLNASDAQIRATIKSLQEFKVPPKPSEEETPTPEKVRTMVGQLGAAGTRVQQAVGAAQAEKKAIWDATDVVDGYTIAPETWARLISDANKASANLDGIVQDRSRDGLDGERMLSAFGNVDVAADPNAKSLADAILAFRGVESTAKALAAELKNDAESKLPNLQKELLRRAEEKQQKTAELQAKLQEIDANAAALVANANGLRTGLGAKLDEINKRLSDTQNPLDQEKAALWRRDLVSSYLDPIAGYRENAAAIGQNISALVSETREKGIGLRGLEETGSRVANSMRVLTPTLAEIESNIREMTDRLDRIKGGGEERTPEGNVIVFYDENHARIDVAQVFQRLGNIDAGLVEALAGEEKAMQEIVDFVGTEQEAKVETFDNWIKDAEKEGTVEDLRAQKEKLVEEKKSLGRIKDRPKIKTLDEQIAMIESKMEQFEPRMKGLKTIRASQKGALTNLKNSWTAERTTVERANTTVNDALQVTRKSLPSKYHERLGELINLKKEEIKARKGTISGENGELSGVEKQIKDLLAAMETLNTDNKSNSVEYKEAEARKLRLEVSKSALEKEGGILDGLTTKMQGLIDELGKTTWGTEVVVPPEVTAPPVPPVPPVPPRVEAPGPMTIQEFDAETQGRATQLLRGLGEAYDTIATWATMLNASETDPHFSAEDAANTHRLATEAFQVMDPLPGNGTLAQQLIALLDAQKVSDIPNAYTKSQGDLAKAYSARGLASGVQGMFDSALAKYNKFKSVQDARGRAAELAESPETEAKITAYEEEASQMEKLLGRISGRLESLSNADVLPDEFPSDIVEDAAKVDRWISSQTVFASNTFVDGQPNSLKDPVRRAALREKHTRIRKSVQITIPQERKKLEQRIKDAAEKRKRMPPPGSGAGTMHTGGGTSAAGAESLSRVERDAAELERQTRGAVPPSLLSMILPGMPGEDDTARSLLAGVALKRAGRAPVDEKEIERVVAEQIRVQLEQLRAKDEARWARISSALAHKASESELDVVRNDVRTLQGEVAESAELKEVVDTLLEVFTPVPAKEGEGANARIAEETARANAIAEGRTEGPATIESLVATIPDALNVNGNMLLRGWLHDNKDLLNEISQQGSPEVQIHAGVLHAFTYKPADYIAGSNIMLAFKEVVKAVTSYGSRMSQDEMRSLRAVLTELPNLRQQPAVEQPTTGVMSRDGEAWLNGLMEWIVPGTTATRVVSEDKQKSSKLVLGLSMQAPSNMIFTAEDWTVLEKVKQLLDTRIGDPYSKPISVGTTVPFMTALSHLKGALSQMNIQKDVDPRLRRSIDEILADFGTKAIAQGVPATDAEDMEETPAVPATPEVVISTDISITPKYFAPLPAVLSATINASELGRLTTFEETQEFSAWIKSANKTVAGSGDEFTVWISRIAKINAADDDKKFRANVEATRLGQLAYTASPVKMEDVWKLQQLVRAALKSGVMIIESKPAAAQAGAGQRAAWESRTLPGRLDAARSELLRKFLASFVVEEQHQITATEAAPKPKGLGKLKFWGDKAPRTVTRAVTERKLSLPLDEESGRILLSFYSNKGRLAEEGVMGEPGYLGAFGALAVVIKEKGTAHQVALLADLMNRIGMSGGGAGAAERAAEPSSWTEDEDDGAVMEQIDQLQEISERRSNAGQAAAQKEQAEGDSMESNDNGDDVVSGDESESHGKGDAATGKKDTGAGSRKGFGSRGAMPVYPYGSRKLRNLGRKDGENGGVRIRA